MSKMAVRIEARPRSTLEDFAVRHGLTMVVRERSAALGFPEGGTARWYAQFEGAEVMEAGCLRGVFGNGATAEQAIAAYGQAISECRLVIGAYKPSRHEIEVPIIVSSSNVSTGEEGA